MIKLERPDKPSELTEEKEKELVQEFKDTERAVWRKDYITEPLFNMSHGKCCYCETVLGTQARPMNVEHFHCKEAYPNEVVTWDNLLPSCGQCNSNKGKHDTIKDGLIINPTIDNPKEYLYLKYFMIKSKDNQLGSIGRRTVELLDLNNRERLVNPRILIADTMRQKLENIHEKAVDLAGRQDGKQYNRTKIVNGIRDILRMAQPDAEYSAFMSTIILTDEDYLETRDILIAKELWTKEFEVMHNKASEIKLDTEIK
ncbi:MAG: hypothetical protein PHV18_14795 [Lachnospiraceae bacterium]|nr:hypothetical protein [Lachnospiraceae bacterium]